MEIACSEGQQRMGERSKMAPITLGGDHETSVYLS